MWDRYLGLLFSYPGAFIAIGQVQYRVAGALAILGLRLDRVFDKIVRRTGEPSDMLAAFPWWLRFPIPESPAGWAAVVSLAVTGICFVKVGKWARRQY